MAIENVTVNLGLKKMTFETNDDLWDLWSTKLLPAGWVGGITNAAGIDGKASTDCVLNATSPDKQLLVVHLNSTVVTVINAGTEDAPTTYAAMTEDEYQARYCQAATP